jgi:glycosyltransferase involved in cell wall biosynthesis
VQRVLKFVKYLPSFGWNPVVLTVPEDADFPARDASLGLELPPEAKVLRVRIFEPYGLYRKWTGRGKSDPIDIATNTLESVGSVSERLAQWVRATFFIPDARRFWKGPAVREGGRLLASGGIDAILSSAPPYTCHLIGRALSRRFRVPWIADFRDSWVGWLSAPRRWWLPDAVDRRLERGVLRQADRILAVSDGVRDDLKSRNPEVPMDKWRILPNGFDSADFEGLVPCPSKDRFVLVYTGSLYGKRNPIPLLRAVESLLTARPALRGVLRIRFVGRMDPAYADAFLTLGEVFEHVPYVPHRESLQTLVDASALLLVIDEATSAGTIVTGKVYEYLAAKKPVLAIAPEGDAARLIRSLGAGAVVPPDAPAKMEAVLAGWIDAWKRNAPLPRASDADVRRFERKALAAELAGVLEGLASKA